MRNEAESESGSITDKMEGLLRGVVSNVYWIILSDCVFIRYNT